jgi:hypothetical protein
MPENFEHCLVESDFVWLMSLEAQNCKSYIIRVKSDVVK